MFHFFERWRSGLRWIARYLLTDGGCCALTASGRAAKRDNEFSSSDMIAM
jgi:hypothetical protein